MGRATFDNYPDKFLNIDFPTVVESFPWDVTREGEDITFKLGEGEDEKFEVHKTTDVRKFLLENFNWNGIVHFMHLLSDKNDNFTYTRPTDLKGIPSDDDILIIPDEATEAIVYEQAKYVIETKYADAPADNIDKILKYVDGKAKTGFSVDTLETTYDDLIKESDNSEMSYNETSFTMPDLDTVSESDLYDFLKNLGLSRNGLWINENKATNFISIRRVLDTGSSKYNDTSFLAWKEGGTKKALQYIGSTEPGNLSHGQLLPQTATMILGIHDTSNATPAGRTRNAYRKGNGNTNHYFQSGDTTMNVHYASHGIYKKGFPKDKEEYGLNNNSDGSFYEGDELEAYLTVISVFKILSRWGTGSSSSNITSYENLENHIKDFTVSNILGTTDQTKKIEINKGADTVVKIIKYSTYTAFVGTNYGVTGKKSKDKVRKNSAIKLLMNYHNRQNDGTLQSTYDSKELKDLVDDLKQDTVFKSIVETQLEEELNFKKVDAQPGKGTINKIDRTDTKKQEDTQAYDELKEKAENDFEELESLLAVWDSNSILKNTLKSQFKNKFRINSVDYKDSDKKDVDNSGGIGFDKGVGGWSEGCQVILGGQHFYEFMYMLTQYVTESDQKRWYYTLVDIDTIGGVVKGEPIEEASTEPK